MKVYQPCRDASLRDVELRLRCHHHARSVPRRRWSRGPSPFPVRGWAHPASGQVSFFAAFIAAWRFPVAGRRPEPLALPAGRRLALLRDLPRIVQEHAAQRPRDVLRAGFVEVVRDRPLRRPARAGLGWILRGFGGLAPPGGRCRDALAPRRCGRGVQEDQRVPPALEGGVMTPAGAAALAALVNLPARPRVPASSGAAGLHDSPGAVLASGTRGCRACRPGGVESASSCLRSDGAGRRRPDAAALQSPP